MKPHRPVIGEENKESEQPRVHHLGHYRTRALASYNHCMTLESLLLSQDPELVRVIAAHSRKNVH